MVERSKKADPTDFISHKGEDSIDLLLQSTSEWEGR